MSQLLDEILPVITLHFDHVGVKSFVIGLETERPCYVTEAVPEVAGRLRELDG